MSPLHDAYKHWPCPQRVRVQTLIKNQASLSVVQDKKKHPSQRILFSTQDIPRSTAQQIVKSKQSQRLHTYSESRGRKKKLVEADIRTVEDILWQGGFQAHSLN